MARPRNSRWPLAALAALLLPLSTQAVAQSFDPPPVIAPLKIEPDRNKVNVTTGKTEIDVPSLGVPAAPRLHWDKVQNSAPYMRGTSSAGGEEMPPAGYSVTTTGANSESFRCLDWDCTTPAQSGS